MAESGNESISRSTSCLTEGLGFIEYLQYLQIKYFPIVFPRKRDFRVTAYYPEDSRSKGYRNLRSLYQEIPVTTDFMSELGLLQSNNTWNLAAGSYQNGVIQ